MQTMSQGASGVVEGAANHRPKKQKKAEVATPRPPTPPTAARNPNSTRTLPQTARPCPRQPPHRKPDGTWEIEPKRRTNRIYSFFGTHLHFLVLRSRVPLAHIGDTGDTLVSRLLPEIEYSLNQCRSPNGGPMTHPYRSTARPFPRQPTTAHNRKPDGSANCILRQQARPHPWTPHDPVNPTMRRQTKSLQNDVKVVAAHGGPPVHLQMLGQRGLVQREPVDRIGPKRHRVDAGPNHESPCNR